jgi:hypothetical protein
MTALSTPAEVLREAAWLMRERATAAVNDPAESWMVNQSPDEGLIVGTYMPGDVDEDGTVSTACVAFFAYPDGVSKEAYRGAMDVATHMASWQPVVALAVADLLDAEATWAQDRPPTPEGYGYPEDSKCLRIARAYLGVTP